MGLRELKRERTRRVISDKAFELFRDHGFGRTTVEQIAAAAEVGPSTLYRYYPTKETLVLEFVEESLFGAVRWLRDQPDTLPVPAGLRAVIERVLDQLETNPDRVRAVYELADQTPSVNARLADLIWRFRDELAAELTRRLTTGAPELASGHGRAGKALAFKAAMAAGVAMNVIEIAVELWVADPAVDAKGLADDAMVELSRGGIPFPA